MKKKTYVSIPGNYYDKHNSKNPLVRFLMKRFHKQLFSFMAQTRAQTLIDVGCGEGYTTNKVKKVFPHMQIKGYDFESKAVEKAKARKLGIEFLEGSIYELPEEDNASDVVMASEVLEHLEDPHKAIQETKRVAKTYCIYSVPYEPFWRMANMARGAYLKDFGNTPGHIQHWNKTSFRRMLKKHFPSVKVRTAGLWNIALCKKES